jgi:hypothetical protein
MSRPLKKASKLRRPFKTYFTPDELAIIDEKAESAGLPLSTFIREATLGKRIISVPTVNVRQWSELSRLSSNLNQLTAHLNLDGEPLSTFEWREIFFAVQEARQAADQVRIALTTGIDPDVHQDQ